MSALAMMKRPDVFKVGVSGAPVSEWRDYDTHYTERFLGTPEDNAKGYDESSLLGYAPKLEGPLLVIHGTNDDNVYFVHSLKLADALFKAGKTFEFLPLQGFTHMVPDPLVQERLYTRIAGFLMDHLKP
jgi:dipeptidyl-peptidase-4